MNTPITHPTTGTSSVLIETVRPLISKLSLDGALMSASRVHNDRTGGLSSGSCRSNR